jgi:hypothetical protein
MNLWSGAALAQGVAGRFNVKDFGATGDGVTDDTPRVQAALNAIRDLGRGALAGSGVLYFPPGIYNVTGGFDLTLMNGLAVVGAGIGATTLRITDPTQNLFFWNFATVNQTYRDFSVSAGTTRTGGWVLRGPNNPSLAFGALIDARIRDIDIKGQANGIWLPQYSFVWIDRVRISSFSVDGGIGIKAGQTNPSVSQGSNLYIQATQVEGSFVGPKPEYAYVIEDASSVFMADSGGSATRRSGLKIISNGNVARHLHFSQCAFDATAVGPTAHLTGAGSLLNLAFTGCVFNRAGQAGQATAEPHGVYIDVFTIGLTQFTGGRFTNAKGDGLFIGPVGRTGNADVTLTGVAVRLNGRTGIDVDAPLNALGPVITGVDEVGSGLLVPGGLDLVLGPTTNRVVVVGNRFVSGKFPPQTGAHNGP